jgi:hypothetical protein
MCECNGMIFGIFYPHQEKILLKILNILPHGNVHIQYWTLML